MEEVCGALHRGFGSAGFFIVPFWGFHGKDKRFVRDPFSRKGRFRVPKTVGLQTVLELRELGFYFLGFGDLGV